MIQTGVVEPERKRDIVKAVLLKVALAPLYYLAMCLGMVGFVALSCVAILAQPVLERLDEVIRVDAVHSCIASIAFGPAELIERAGGFSNF